MKTLIVILDGLSYVVTNVFCWWRKNLLKLWKLPGSTHRMLYVDVYPETPQVLTNFFQIRKYVPGKTTQWIWELFEKLDVKVINIPVQVPPIYYNVERPRNWVDYYTPPRERFKETVDDYHRFILDHGGAEVLITWYPVPDQAHHHFFATAHDPPSLNIMLDYYDLAAKYALELIEHYKPKKYIILSDHGLSSDVQDKSIPGLYHIRDATIATNVADPPDRASEIIYFIYKVFKQVSDHG